MFLDKLRIEDLPEEQKLIANVIGIEDYKKLVKNFGGNCLYICKKETITKRLRNYEIISKFTGNNYRAIAMEYKMSERTIRQIIKDNIIKKVKADKLTIDNLPEEQMLIADTIGIDKYMILTEKFGGCDIYLLEEHTLTLELRNEEIINSFTGNNYHQLAIKYGMSESNIRNIISKANQ